MTAGSGEATAENKMSYRALRGRPRIEPVLLPVLDYDGRASIRDGYLFFGKYYEMLNQAK